MKIVLSALAALTMVLAVPAAASESSDLFTTRCASCHGPDGKGKTKMGEKMGVPDLTKVKDSPAALEKVISDGKGKMMAYKGKLTPEQIKGLAGFVKTGLK
jgi:mono/diheme cytochrome c family protein